MKDRAVNEDKSDPASIDELFDEDDLVEKPAPAPAKEPVKQAEPKVQPAPQPPTHPRGLRSRAMELGASTEQIDSVSTDELDDWVYSETKRIERASTPAPVPPVEDEIDAMGQDLAFDPRFAKLLKTQRDELKSLKETIKQKEEAEKASAQRVRNESIDDAFDSMEGRYEKMVGSGSGDELSTAEKKRRRAIFAAAGLDPQKLPSPKAILKKLKAAADELFDLKEEPKPEVEVEEEQPKRGKQVTKEEWDEAGTPAPTQLAPRKRTGDAAAIASIARWQEAKNIVGKGGAYDQSQLSGVPD